MFSLSPFDFMTPQTSYYPRAHSRRSMYADQSLDDYDDLPHTYSRMELNELARRRQAQLERERQAQIERQRRAQLERQAQIERERAEAQNIAYLCALEREHQQREYAQRIAYARAMEERRRLAQEAEQERAALHQRVIQQRVAEHRKSINARESLKQQLAQAARSKQSNSPLASPAKQDKQSNHRSNNQHILIVDTPSSVLIEDEPITPDQWNLDSEDVFSVDRIQSTNQSIVKSDLDSQ